MARADVVLALLYEAKEQANQVGGVTKGSSDKIIASISAAITTLKAHSAPSAREAAEIREGMSRILAKLGEGDDPVRVMKWHGDRLDPPPRELQAGDPVRAYDGTGELTYNATFLGVVDPLTDESRIRVTEKEYQNSGKTPE